MKFVAARQAAAKPYLEKPNCEFAIHAMGLPEPHGRLLSVYILRDVKAGEQLLLPPYL